MTPLKQCSTSGDQSGMLEFVKVQKSYGAQRVLDIPHFRLENGLYWLQGPNGAGKTTLLRIIAGIERFIGCCMLYAMLRTQAPADYDLRLPYFVFSLALFGHGLLLYRCRELETTRLLWYRNLPVPRMRRFIQIALFCGVLLIPEMLLLAWLTPDPIRIRDSVSFILSGYSVLLLLYSGAATIAMDDYLKLCLVLFGILYVSVLSGLLIGMSGFFLATACVLFWRGY